MGYLTQADLANYENVEIPEFHRSNFSYSFSLLPSHERDAINSVYSFCSYIDDIVDNNSANSFDELARKNDRLQWWEKEIEKVYSGRVSSPLLTPLVAVVDRFHIPKQYFMTLIDGCKRDLTKKRYASFEELKEYCYGVASVVGLISIDIFGYKYEETKNYAVNLGYALQLTNIIRDIKEDKNRGYIYIPQDELDSFAYSESDLIKEIYNDNFVELMRFQAKRAREYFHKARTSLRPDEKNTMIAAEVMDAIYYRLLEKIELKEFDVYKNRIRVSNIHKVMIAFKYWLSNKMFVKRIKS